MRDLVAGRGHRLTSVVVCIYCIEGKLLSPGPCGGGKRRRIHACHMRRRGEKDEAFLCRLRHTLGQPLGHRCYPALNLFGLWSGVPSPFGWRKRGDTAQVFSDRTLFRKVCDWRAGCQCVLIVYFSRVDLNPGSEHLEFLRRKNNFGVSDPGSILSW